jgi:queuosine precursor transporter
MAEPVLEQRLPPNHPFKYYDIIGILSIAVVLITNTVAQKIVPVGPFNLNAGIMIFPIAYILSDVLTEVYGYARARRITWMIFICQALMVLCYQAAVMMPHADFWPNQAAFEAVLGNVPRIAVASATAILIGDFVNCYVMSKMKILTKGKHLWLRTIGSTFFGQGADSVVFFTIAFLGTMPFTDLANALVSGWLMKTVYEVIATPITYWVVARMKRAEGIDHFDYGVDYTPFSLKVDG